MFIEVEQLTLDPKYQRDPLEEIPVREENPDRAEILRILREARDLLARPYGWVKQSTIRHRSKQNGGGYAYCAVGAIHFAATGQDGYTDKRNHPEWAAASLVAEEMGVYRSLPDHIPEWNDHRDTRKKDVLAAFDKAILRAEEGA